VRSSVRSIHYLGSYDASYARHRILQKGLRELGLTVTETLDQGFLPFRWIRLSSAMRRVPTGVPIIVGESGNFLTPVLWFGRLLGRPPVFDTFLSLQDTLADRHAGPGARSLAAVGGIIDRLNCRAAALILVDTEQSRRYFSTALGVDPAKLEVVYVGAETDLFTPIGLPRATNRPVQVLFYGTFIPLHGIAVILQAAARVQRSGAAITFRIVGNGQEYSQMRSLAARLRLSNVTFGPAFVRYEDLPRLIGTSDICLGVFASRAKTQRVIPHKVFQAAACGRPVVTADTPAIREVFSDDTAALVTPGDPDALAMELVSLADDPTRREALARRGAALVHGEFSPRAIAARLMTRLA